jgi:hypothetical protein
VLLVGGENDVVPREEIFSTSFEIFFSFACSASYRVITMRKIGDFLHYHRILVINVYLAAVVFFLLLKMNIFSLGWSYTHGKN